MKNRTALETHDEADWISASSGALKRARCMSCVLMWLDRKYPPREAVLVWSFVSGDAGWLGGEGGLVVS